MKTGNSVLDGTLNDEKLGKLFRRTSEIKRRIEDGTISYSDAIAVMQLIIEGKSKRDLVFFAPPEWKVWKRLEPISLSASAMEVKLRQMCKEDDNYPLGLLSRFPYLFDGNGILNHYSVDLVKVNILELGFSNKEAPVREKVHLRAQNLGLKLCHPSVAYRLRLAYSNQKKKELLEIGMNPIITPEYDSVVFQIENYGNLRIGYVSRDEQRYCTEDESFIFRI